MKITEYLKDHILYLDGGMGTLLQAEGLAPGELPERWNLTHAEAVRGIHRAYYDAGSNVVATNTFGANSLKFPAEELDAIVRAAIENARAAGRECCGAQPKWVALDIGPTGRMLKPYGDLDFEDAVAVFAETVRLGVKHGADLILIETMSDSYETKAALLAAKENSDLPVFVSNAYDGSGKLMLTGATPSAMVAMLEGLGADAIGVNCSLGPDALLPVVEQYLAHASLPVLVMPNAGLPTVRDGHTVYDLSPADFGTYMRRMAESGACVLGGCCGTTPEYIAAMVQAVRDVPFAVPTPKCETLVSSYNHAVRIGEEPVLIGGRINPAGDPELVEALRTGDVDTVLSEGMNQAEEDVHLLDINVGLSGIDESELMCEAVTTLQSVIDLPLQLTTANPAVLERAARLYNGKPLINAVTGKRESMDTVFPIVQKYGGVVVALAIGEEGIPDTAEGRAAVIDDIVREAAEYGIAPHDILADPLCVAVSSDENAAAVTLEAVRLIRKKGIAVSLSLPRCDAPDAAFFSAALEAGLNAAILDPYAEELMNAYHAYRRLHGPDPV